MKRTTILALTLALTTLTFLTGCIDFTIDTTPQYTHYPLNHDLESVTTTLPSQSKMNCNASVTIYYPNGTTRGTYHRFAKRHTITIETPAHILHKTGIYTVKWETHDTIYYEYFFVGSLDPRIMFDVTDFNIENHKYNIEVTNNGNIDGFLFYITYDPVPTTSNGVTYYNKYIENDIVFVKNGHFKEITHSTESNDIIILVNGDLYHHI